MKLEAQRLILTPNHGRYFSFSKKYKNCQFFKKT